MNAYQHATELGLTGTDAEIVAILKTLGANDINPADVSAWMRERGLWIIGPDQQFGTLYDLYATTDDATVKAALAEWYASVLSGQAQTIRMTRPDIAQRVAALTTLVSATLENGEQLVTEFYSLCGGRPFADLTAEQFAADRDQATQPDSTPEWDGHTVQASIVSTPEGARASVRICRSGTRDGQRVTGPVVSTIASVDPAADSRLAPVLAAIQTLADAEVSNG